ncbi:lytic polysaccharide monooxygenase [Pseudoalteromonas aliena]|uniref:lytic polysaccharide monooxygenase n=1 Tax=Pseudoalteromonas aliena TaxID=247523 RepID=UPI0024957460|nr:lytic polysaccharide monooxygenase [Pseudoalteromonas aliena]
MTLIKFKTLSLSAVSSCVLLAIMPAQVTAHGYMDSPKARQAFCKADAGYWWPTDGSAIPNLACRAAFLESGTVQFVQDIEFSVNTPDYLNQAAVEEKVPNGLLCAGGDNEKRGMDLPSPHWQRSDIVPNANGEVKIRYHATTPHNPSFWQFYLTKPSFNAATDVLTWADLELVQEHSNIDFTKGTQGNRYYEMDVAIPQGRSGNAILYSRWQRVDQAGEGFYNCSDINIISDATPVEPSQWSGVGYFVRQGQTATVGDTVWARLFDESGQEVINQQFKVTAQNSANWQQALAAQLNLDYAHLMQVGVQNEAGDVVFNDSDTLINQVYSSNADYTYTLSVQSSPTNTAPIVNAPADLAIDENTSTKVHLHAFDDEQNTLTYNWSVPAPLSFTGGDANIELNAPEVTADTDYTVSVSVSDGELTTQVRFKVTINDSTIVDSDAPKWSGSAVYQAGDKVTYQGVVYTAKWWNQDQQPDESNAWEGETSSEQSNSWKAGKAYQGGAEVIFQNQGYRAKWWTQGDTPGQASVWAKL